MHTWLAGGASCLVHPSGLKISAASGNGGNGSIGFDTSDSSKRPMLFGYTTIGTSP